MRKLALLIIINKIRNNPTTYLLHDNTNIKIKKNNVYNKYNYNYDYYKPFPISVMKQEINYCDTCKYCMPFPDTKEVYSVKFAKCKIYS